MAETHQNPTLPKEELQQLQQLQQRLLSEQQRLKHELYELTSGDESVSMADSTLEGGGLVSDQADNADTLSDYERTRAIIAHTQQLFTQVNEALARIDAGTYGICTNCGRPIPLARLQALPYVTLCIDCQAKDELANKQEG